MLKQWEGKSIKVLALASEQKGPVKLDYHNVEQWEENTDFTVFVSVK